MQKYIISRYPICSYRWVIRHQCHVFFACQSTKPTWTWTWTNWYIDGKKTSRQKTQRGQSIDRRLRLHRDQESFSTNAWSRTLLHRRAPRTYGDGWTQAPPRHPRKAWDSRTWSCVCRVCRGSGCYQIGCCGKSFELRRCGHCGPMVDSQKQAVRSKKQTSQTSLRPLEPSRSYPEPSFCQSRKHATREKQ